MSDGLNILQAPNEAGKSTWCAFLTAMFYGINSRERDKAGFIAEKNRYAPWSGAAMQGRMDCTASGRELTLLRETKRPSAPMGEFKAVYAGTGEAVPGLTGTNCGETLLGVPREVFERSAFIRQSGMGVTADRELERRIASLITSGQEDVSYSEAAEVLKKQINRRQHNKTGLIPSAQGELEEVRRQLADLRDHREALASTRQEAELFQGRLRDVEAELGRWQSYQAKEQRLEQEAAASASQRAKARADTLRQAAETDGIPELDAIGRLRGAVVNLETARKSAARARKQQEEAEAALSGAQARLKESPFAGKTPEQAEAEPLDIGAKPKYPIWAAILALLLGAALGGALWYMGQGLPLAIGCGCGAFGGLALIAGFLSGRRAKGWEAKVQALREERTAQAAAYTSLYKEESDARADLTTKTATADALTSSIESNEAAILREVRRFAPDVSDMLTADEALRKAAVRRKELASAEQEANSAALRQELMARKDEVSAASEDADAPSEPPDRSQAELTDEAEKLRRRLASLQSRMDQLTGQISAVGDPAVLTARAEELEGRVAALTAEYDALTLALETLETANTAIQGRFSPSLGGRAAEIFRELTDGRYTGVVLDRAFHLSAEPKGDSVYRDALLLSAGALDQLYLAVRLAICDLVLPAESAAPIVLDDALTNFDDDRCAAALRWLLREAEHRQILLFTCHTREAAFLAGQEGVHIQTLSR